jgi:hypothetical protein
MLVEDLIIVELKSTEQFHPVHAKQLTTYLRLAKKSLGLLINFGLPLFKDGVKRVVEHLSPEESLTRPSAASAPQRAPAGSGASEPSNQSHAETRSSLRSPPPSSAASVPQRAP